MPAPHATRRTVLENLGLATVGAIGVGTMAATGRARRQATTSAPLTGSQWPSYHYGPGNVGFNPDSRGFDDPISTWATTLADGVAGPIAGPNNIYLGGQYGLVTAVDRETGDVRWTFDSHDEIGIEMDETVLALAGDRVVATLDSTIGALDAADGSVLWSVGLAGNDTSGPTVADGTAYVFTDHGVLRALDVATGETRWRVTSGFGRPDIADDTRYTPAVSPDGETVVVRSDGAVHALATADGSRQWRTEFPAVTTPVVDDAVYVTAADRIAALAPSDGSVQWERTVDTGATTPVAGDGRVICQDGDSVVALDAATGAVDWRWSFPFCNDRRTLAADADTLYVPIQQGGGDANAEHQFVVAVSLADGTEEWRWGRSFWPFTNERPPHALPVGDELFVTIGGDGLHRVVDGSLADRWSVSQAGVSSVTAGDRVLYTTRTGAPRGVIKAREPGDGSVRWCDTADVPQPPVADGQYVLTGESDVVVRRAADGSVAWRESFPGDARPDLLLDGGTLYYERSSDDAVLAAVDLDTGNERWSRTPRNAPFGVSSLAIGGDTLYASQRDSVGAYAISDGRLRRQYDVDLDGLVAAPNQVVGVNGDFAFEALSTSGGRSWVTWPGALTDPSIHTGDVIVAHDDHGPDTYMGFSAADGTKLWEYSTIGPSLTRPVLADGVLYGATGRGKVLAIDPTTGDVVGSRELHARIAGGPGVTDGVVTVSGYGEVYAVETPD